METLDSLHKDNRLQVTSRACVLAKIPPKTHSELVGGSVCSQKSLRNRVYPSSEGLASFLITFIIKECLLMFTMGIIYFLRSVADGVTQVAVSYLFCEPLIKLLCHSSAFYLGEIISVLFCLFYFWGAQHKSAL